MTWMSGETLQHLCASVSWAVMSWAGFNDKSSFFLSLGNFPPVTTAGLGCLPGPVPVWGDGGEAQAHWSADEDPPEVQRTFPRQKGVVGQSRRDPPAHAV